MVIAVGEVGLNADEPCWPGKGVWIIQEMKLQDLGRLLYGAWDVEKTWNSLEAGRPDRICWNSC